MTDGIDQALVNAGLDLLGADAGLTVHDGVLPDGAVPPYVLAYPMVDWLVPDTPDHSLAAQSAIALVCWYCHCVGANATAARAVAQRVRTQLLDVTPAVAGMRCWPIRQVEAVPPDRDESTGTVWMDAVVVYEMRACRA